MITALLMSAKILPLRSVGTRQTWLNPRRYAPIALMVAACFAFYGMPDAGAQDFVNLPSEARNANDAYRRLAAIDAHSMPKIAQPQHESRKNFQEAAEPPKTICSEGTRQFCSDLANAQFEFKPLKVLLPDIPRLTPHNVYIRRNKITVAYTFR